MRDVVVFSRDKHQLVRGETLGSLVVSLESQCVAIWDPTTTKARASPNSNSNPSLKQAHIVHFLIDSPSGRQHIEPVQVCRPGVASKPYGVGGRACIVYRIIPTHSTVQCTL